MEFLIQFALGFVALGDLVPGVVALDAVGFAVTVFGVVVFADLALGIAAWVVAEC